MLIILFLTCPRFLFVSSILLAEGEYFSEEQMRMREPLLYEQYIGQFLTDEEVIPIHQSTIYL